MVNSFEHVIHMFIYRAILYYHDSISGKANTYNSPNKQAVYDFVGPKKMTLFFIPIRIITFVELHLYFYNSYYASGT